MASSCRSVPVLSGCALTLIAVALNAIACETCRNKKRKVSTVVSHMLEVSPSDFPQCDRRLPTCSYCAGHNQRCLYSEPYRRGFPEGYLSGLEQRLTQTELALFEALTSFTAVQASQAECSAHGLTGPIAGAFKNQALATGKAGRMAEWERLPLDTREGMRRWYQAKAAELGLGGMDGGNVRHQPPPGRPPYEELLGEQEQWTENPLSLQSGGIQVPAAQPFTLNQSPAESGTPAESWSNQAGRLADSQTRKFF